MLFGRGSTGGAVNQVSKQPRGLDESEISTTVGSHNYRRMVGDFSLQTGSDAGLRITAMATKADNNGAGSSLDKKGIAGTYRFGIGTANEFSLGLYSLKNNNGMNYGMPWIKPTGASATNTSTIIERLDPTAYYGMASDYNKGSADHITASHTHRFGDDSELKTTVRKGIYTRDQRAGTVRLGLTNNTVGLDNLSDSTVVRRGNNPKIQDLNALYAQSDYSTQFEAFGYKHAVLSGIDMAQEGKRVYRASAVTKPNTTLGTPNDGAWIDEDARTLSLSSAFAAANLGIYAQDMVQIAQHWKVLGGLRYDRMRGTFDSVDAAGVTTSSYNQTMGDWSERVGVLYQPNALHSYHLSYGTSFNTSADTYSYSALSASTPPEQSRNIELGAKLDTADKMFTTRLALFQSTKLNERNTDPDSAATQFLLSGQRHTTGFEVDITGRITPKWEIFGSYMWMPDAMIDVSNATGNGARQGERPGLTPIHSGTVWTTFQWSSALRVGGGVNFRSEQSPSSNPGFMAPGYATMDLMAEYQFNARYALKTNIANVTNKLYADSLYTGHYIPGSGRNLQATLHIKF
jgi:catecholate siderophore receptor